MGRWDVAKNQADSIIVTDDLLDEQKNIDLGVHKKHEAYLDSVSKAIDNVSRADSRAAVDLHKTSNAATHLQFGQQKYQDAENALLDYYDSKELSEVDEVELAYQQFLHNNTGPDGTYFLENYETWAKTDAAWLALKEEISPQGWDKVNPFYEPDQRTLEAFQRKDLEKRQQFLDLNQKSDNMYDVLISSDGNPTEEYQEILNKRQLAFDTIADYNDTAGENPLDINEVVINAKKINAEDVNISMNELYQSDNIQKLIDELAETEYQARMTRSPLNFLTLAPPLAGGYGSGTTVEQQQSVTADRSLQAAADLDPNLFMTHLGLYDKGWDKIGAKGGWFTEELQNPEEVLTNLESQGLDPQLFGFMPEDYESELDTGDQYFKELLLEAQNQAQ